VDGDPADLGAGDLDLPHMDAGPGVDPDAGETFQDRRRAVHGAGRLVERGEEPVAGRVDLAAAEAFQLLADESVMRGQDLAPSPIADLNGLLR
jgi:hypothetical protein